MKLVLLVGLGSFIGGMFRYMLSVFIHSKIGTTFPIGTMSVNVLGSLLIGIVFGLSERSNLSVEWRIFLATGILGGFTTFSSFSNESLGMIREGQFLLAGSYILGSILLGLVATFIGIGIVKIL
jgi:CrcB protein